MGACPLPAYDGVTTTAITGRGRHEKSETARIRATAHARRNGSASLAGGGFVHSTTTGFEGRRHASVRKLVRSNDLRNAARRAERSTRERDGSCNRAANAASRWRRAGSSPANGAPATPYRPRTSESLSSSASDIRRPLLLGFRDGRRALGADELWPNAVPVVGTHIPTHDRTRSHALDCSATLNRNWPVSSGPLMHRRRRNGQRSRQGGETAHRIRSRLDWVVHGRMVRRCLTHVNRHCLIEDA